MSNFDIDSYFGFRVHFPRDKLPEKLSDGDIFIINTDEAVGKGKHFVAMKNVNGCTMYFDSFGMEMLPEAKKLAKTRGDEIVRNTYRIQDINSGKCGYFSIDWINSVHDYNSYLSWLLEYSPNNFDRNDKIVLKRLGLQ